MWQKHATRRKVQHSAVERIATGDQPHKHSSTMRHLDLSTVHGNRCEWPVIRMNMKKINT